jgi:predicted Zn-dependent peptidase
VNENLHSFCLCLYIKAGSMYEQDELNGATHLWEHLLFRKLNRAYGGSFYKVLSESGLSFDACTYKEFVTIKITGAKKHFSRAAGIMALIFGPMNLTAKEIDAEKRIVKSEKREDGEEYTLDYFTQKIVWGSTPLANTIAGKYKVIDKIGVKAADEIQKKILSAGNVFFYVTGNVSDEDIVRLSELIGSYELAGDIIRDNMAPVPESFFKREGQVEVKNSQRHYIRFSFDVDTKRYSYAELSLLYDILFSGFDSKIYMELAENSGLIYSFDAKLEMYRNIGNMYFSFEIEKKNILPAIRKVIGILRAMKTSVTEDLSFALPYYVDNAEMEFDDAESLNWTMAYERHIMKNSYGSIADRKKEFLGVTPERIMEMAEDIFTRDNMLITLKTDKKSFDLREVYKIVDFACQ